MESSSSLSRVFTSTSQTSPSKLSLSAPLSLSSSVHIRAPLTLDDDEDETVNDDTDLESFETSSREFESNYDDPDEENWGSRVGSEGSSFDDRGGSSLKLFVRPIAQLSWDSDGDDSDFSPGVSVAPRVKVGASEESDFRAGDDEERCFEEFEESSRGDLGIDRVCEIGGFEACCGDVATGKSSEPDSGVETENGGVGVLESCEECGSKVDVGVIENVVEVEEYDVIESHGFEFEGCEESDLAASEEKTSKVDSGIEQFCVEELEIEKRDRICFLESCEESSSLGLIGEEVSTKKTSRMNVGVESYEAGTEKTLKADSGIEQFCVEKLEIEKRDRIWFLESCEESSSLGMIGEEVSTKKTSKMNVGVESYEESNLAASEEVGAEKSSEVELGFREFCCSVVTETQSLAMSEEVVTEKSSESGSRFEQFNVETDVLRSIENCPENEPDSTVAKELNSLSDNELGIQNESCSNEISSQYGGIDEDEKKKMKHLKLLRAKFLKLVHNLEISLQDCKVTEVLNKLAISSEQNPNNFGSIESENETELEFSLKILVLGKSGVGKSSTINLVLGEKKASIDPFEPSTSSLEEFVGTVNGVDIRILDTPGLKVPSANRKSLSNLRNRVKKFRPDIVLYVDRLDTDTTDTDFPIVKSITHSLGPSIWENAILVLTHSSSVPLDGPLGLPISNNIIAGQKSYLLRESIGKSLGNSGSKKSNLGRQVTMVENHPKVSEDNSNGRSELLLLCYSMKVLSLANLAPRENKKLSNLLFRSRSAPTPNFPWLLFHSFYQENELSCITRNDTKLLRTLETGQVFASLGDDMAEGVRVAHGAHIKLRPGSKMAVRVSVDDTKSVLIHVVSSGSGLVPIALAWVLQMVVSGLVNK